jgi:ribonuclease HI
MGIYFGENDDRNISKQVTGKQSNNTAELGAILYVYKLIEKDILSGKHIAIVSDSKYAIRCVSSYGKKCSAENWKSDIPNKDMVRTAYELYKDKPNVHFVHIMAHTGKDDVHSLGNEGADKLANLAIGHTQCPYSKVYLNVPFACKEEAKTLGAKWDAGKKKWYIFDNAPTKTLLLQKFS